MNEQKKYWRKRNINFDWLRRNPGFPLEAVGFCGLVASSCTRGYYDAEWKVSTLKAKFGNEVGLSSPDIEHLMHLVIEFGIVKTYTVEGDTYAYIPGWVDKDKNSFLFQALDETKEGQVRVPTREQADSSPKNQPVRPVEAPKKSRTIRLTHKTPKVAPRVCERPQTTSRFNAVGDVNTLRRSRDKMRPSNWKLNHMGVPDLDELVEKGIITEDEKALAIKCALK